MSERERGKEKKRIDQSLVKKCFSLSSFDDDTKWFEKKPFCRNVLLRREVMFRHSIVYWLPVKLIILWHTLFV